MKNYHKLPQATIALGVTLGVVGMASAANRIFDLHLENGLIQPISILISPTAHNCYEGTPGIGSLLGPISSGDRATITLARVQGHGCDGEQGVFQLQPTIGQNEALSLNFDNEGNLALSSITNSYTAHLTDKSSADESYTLVIQPIEARLSAPVDAAFTQPHNPIAGDAGSWGGDSRIQRLPMENQPSLGLWGNFYDDCVGIELFHPQHVVRLPNKHGNAYFVVAQSRAHNGWISVLRSNPGQLDTVTDQLKPNGDGYVGQYIWQDLYKDNPVGNWNHPGKMDVIGNVLIVAAQNWAENAPCFYGAGSSEDKVLFYDVRDPEAPRYWGAISASQLGVSEISTTAIVRASDGSYLLNAGGDGSYATWSAASLSPDITHWTRVSTLENSFSGQHGMNFNSYQNQHSLPGSVVPAGTERIMYFDASGEHDRISFVDFRYDPASHSLTRAGYQDYAIDLPGANRDWDSNSLYISADGTPILYSMESAPGEHGALYQVVMGN
jgi:hypothetical protein